MAAMSLVGTYSGRKAGYICKERSTFLSISDGASLKLSAKSNKALRDGLFSPRSS